jgi:hypothetical protein
MPTYREFERTKSGQCAGIRGPVDIRTRTIRLGRILRAQDKSTPKRETEHNERKLPWHSTSHQTPLNENSMTSSPPRPLSHNTGEARRGALLFLLARSDAGMRSLDKGERPWLVAERGETGKPSTARTCTHEERGRV